MKPVIVYEQVGDRVIETDDLPRIVDPTQIVDRIDTVLDPDILKNGRWLYLERWCLDYAGREISEIWVPPIAPMEDRGMWVMHPVMWMANQITRILQQVRESVTPVHALQKMVSHYQGIAERELVGKTGLIRQVVIGTRMKHSGRAVLIPEGSYHPEEVGIPGRFFADMGIEHLDLIMIGRNPTIWNGSIEIVKARRSPNNVVELHPLLFEQLGGDCDGDDIYFVPVPKTPECQAEAEQELLAFCARNATWRKQTLLEHVDAAVDWSDPKADTKRRFEVSGFSISPRDVLSGGDRQWKLATRITGKEDLREACKKIATGLTDDEVFEILAEKNFETLRMKKHLGLIGIACNRLKILSGRVQAWVEAANYLSERLQQTLLDSKHLGDTYSVFEVLDVLNKKNQWEGASVKVALAALGAVPEIDAERCRPIIEAIYIAYPWLLALEDLLPAEIDRGKYRATLNRMGSVSAKMVTKTVQDMLVKDGFGSSRTSCRSLARKHSRGLTRMATRFFPLHEAIAAREPRRGLTRRIFTHGDLDPTGPCRQAWDVWHEMAGVK